MIPASDFLTSTQAPQTAPSSQSTQSSQTSGKLCPTQVPNCSNCGGNSIPAVIPPNTNGICVGLAKYGGFPNGCVCVDPADAPPYAPYGTMEEIDEAVAFLASVSANAINPTTTSDAINPTTTSDAINPTTTPPSTRCNSGLKYTSLKGCQKYCSDGECTQVEKKVKRDAVINYLCTCVSTGGDPPTKVY